VVVNFLTVFAIRVSYIWKGILMSGKNKSKKGKSKIQNTIPKNQHNKSTKIQNPKAGAPHLSLPNWTPPFYL
jgi:hypothetical protein